MTVKQRFIIVVPEPWKICFCSKSGFDGCRRSARRKPRLSCSAYALVGVVVAAEISIIKIGLVYVIMIVITSWRHPALTHGTYFGDLG